MAEFGDLEGLAWLFTQCDEIHRMLSSLRESRQSWRGERTLLRHGQTAWLVGLRREAVAGHDATVPGFVSILTDLSETR